MMEKQYNQLLSLSKTVSDFYENVYAPVLQTLPWLDEGDSLKTASEKVLGNIAFYAYKQSSYNNKNDQETTSKLSTRCSELKLIYKKMQTDLRPILSDLPAEDQSWENLKKMIPKWKSMSSSDLLPLTTHKAVYASFASIQNKASNARGAAFAIDVPTAVTDTIHSSLAWISSMLTGKKMTVQTDDDAAEGVLAKMMAAKIKFSHEKGESDFSIASKFGCDGFWLDRGFLHRIR